MLKCLVDAGDQIDIPDATGRTALMHTAECSFFKGAITYLEHGADVDFANPINGMTTLTYATREGEYNITELLVSKGASVIVAADSLGVSYLHSIRMPIRLTLDKLSSRSER